MLMKKERDTKMCTNYEVGEERNRGKGRERKRKKIYLNVNKASKLQFVHFKHVTYCMSTIPQ